MADMTKVEIEQIIKDYLSTRQIELKDFATISGVDGTTYVLLVQPTGTANKMDVNLLKKQLVAEIKEPADVVINEVKEAGQDAALAVEAATKAVSEANTAATSANEAAETAKQAALNVKDGKTPVFGNVTAKGGDKAAATYKLNGVDENGSPKYDVAFVLEKGADGKHPVLQSGTITTLAPNEQVQASFRANGYDADGRPIYLVDLAIPQGETGKAGDGSGNVLIDPTGLKKDARYLFTPKADGSAEGSFVEYVEPVVGGVNLIVRHNELKEMMVNPSGEEAPCSPSSLMVDFIPVVAGESLCFTKKRNGEGDSNWRYAYYGEDKKTLVSRKTSGYGFFTEKAPIGAFWLRVSYATIDTVKLERGNTPTDFTLSPEDLKAETEALITSKGYQTASDVKSAIDAKVSYLTGSSTITTLTSIPADKRTIIATLSAATNITLKEPLEVGKELLISINPTADFDQPLPVSGDWQSLDGDTLSLKANKPAELSILCVGDSKYVLSSKVAE